MTVKLYTILKEATQYFTYCFSFSKNNILCEKEGNLCSVLVNQR